MVHPEELQLPPRRFAGLAARVSNNDPYVIPAHWDRFRQDETVARITGKVTGSLVSIYTDYESDYTGPYTLVLGYEVAPDAEVPAGLRIVETPPQKYAVILAQGEMPAAVQQAWQWVWASALDRAYTVDFDEYLGPNDVRLHVALR